MSVELESVEKWYSVDFEDRQYHVIIDTYCMGYEPNVRVRYDDDEVLNKLKEQVLDYFYNNLESE